MVPVKGQIEALRRLAGSALQAYPLVDPTLRFVTHGENTTFRVSTASGEQFLLRVHRPNRHGRYVDSAAAVRSELQWLAALRAETDLQVPEPFATSDGALTTTATAEMVPEARICSMLRWMDGRIHAESARPIHLARLATAMAGLHNHADGWVEPDDFVRIRWDWETFFGDTMEYGGLNALGVWDLLPADVRIGFDRVALELRGVMDGLGTRPDAFGLIHADLHLENALFLRGTARLIDFDDCGHGYRMYDIAVALWELRYDDDYEAYRDAFLAAYTAVRPLPAEQLAYLDAFIAARQVAFGLWYAGMAQVNERFAARLDETMAYCGRWVDRLLPA